MRFVTDLAVLVIGLALGWAAAQAIVFAANAVADVVVEACGCPCPPTASCGLCSDAERAAAERARQRLVELAPVGALVYLEAPRPNVYGGRWDARTLLADGTDVAEVLLREGHVRRSSGRREPCGPN